MQTRTLIVAVAAVLACLATAEAIAARDMAASRRSEIMARVTNDGAGAVQKAADGVAGAITAVVKKGPKSKKALARFRAKVRAARAHVKKSGKGLKGVMSVAGGAIGALAKDAKQHLKAAVGKRRFRKLKGKLAGKLARGKLGKMMRKLKEKGKGGKGGLADQAARFMQVATAAAVQTGAQCEAVRAKCKGDAKCEAEAKKCAEDAAKIKKVADNAIAGATQVVKERAKEVKLAEQALQAEEKVVTLNEQRKAASKEAKMDEAKVVADVKSVAATAAAAAPPAPKGKGKGAADAKKF